jgi:hypothetical protein
MFRRSIFDRPDCRHVPRRPLATSAPLRGAKPNKMIGMDMRLVAAAVALGCMTLAGCSSTIFKPVSIDTQPTTSFSLDGKQRVVLVTDRGTKTNSKRVVCAEPSPDALVGIAASVSGALDVAGKGSAKAAASMAEAVQSIGRRSQTIQLLRDGLYRACEAYLNGAINDEEYKLIISRIDDFAVTLVAIDGLTGGQNVPPAVLKLKGSAKTPQGGDAEADASAGEVDTTATAAAAAQVSEANAKAVVEIVKGFYELQKTMAAEDRVTADKILELKEKGLKLEMQAQQLKAEAEAKQKAAKP